MFVGIVVWWLLFAVWVVLGLTGCAAWCVVLVVFGWCDFAVFAWGLVDFTVVWFC